MSQETAFKISGWVGKERYLSTAPPRVPRMAKEEFIVSQQVQFNLLPSPMLPIAKMLNFTVTIVHSVWEIEDAPFFKHDMYDDGDIPLEVVSGLPTACSSPVTAGVAVSKNDNLIVEEMPRNLTLKRKPYPHLHLLVVASTRKSEPRTTRDPFGRNTT
ncbi:hypothetical protein B0H14DRAFT_2564519 [Mycena olivaceomarginata]|nr:hypothetical protein B0H14DRAFT_2564519 [Mycena olivaceomarginata]